MKGIDMSHLEFFQRLVLSFSNHGCEEISGENHYKISPGLPFPKGEEQLPPLKKGGLRGIFSRSHAQS